MGVEVGLASIAVNYFKTQGMSSAQTASFLVSLYWGGALVGRLLGSWMLTKVKPTSCWASFGSSTALILVSMFSSGKVAIGTLVLCGFFNSIMFPNIFTLGIEGLGPMTSKGSGLIMTACVGGAVVPSSWARWPTRSAFSTLSCFPRSATSTSPITGCGDPNLRGLYRRRLDRLEGPPARAGGPSHLRPRAPLLLHQ